MFGSLKADLANEWSIIKPALLKNVALKSAVLFLVWILHSTDNQERRGNVLMNEIYNPNRSWIGSWIISLADWDGLYFLQASLADYHTLKNFAFFPGFSAVITTANAILSQIPVIGDFVNSIPKALVLIGLGFIINFTLHLVNNWLVYKWLRLRGHSQEQAYFAALTFGLGGNTFYHLAFYTETLYMFIVLLSLYLLTKYKNDPASIPWPQFILLTVFFASGGFVRSVGMPNGAYLGYPLVLELVYSLSKLKDLKRVLMVLSRILIIIGCFFTPTIYLFFKTRRLFCEEAPARDPDFEVPEFCESPTGFFYSHIQDKYWRVKLFDYIRHPPDLFNWVWAIVTCIVSTVWLTKSYAKASVQGVLTIHLPEFLAKHDFMSARILEMPDLVIFTIQYVGYYAYAHLGSIERFWSATPAYYLFLVTAQQYLVQKSNAQVRSDKETLWTKVKSNSKYFVPLSLTIRQIIVPVYYASRIYPV